MLLNIFVLLVFGCAWGSAIIAYRKGRSVFGWLILGAMFQAFAVILLLCLPPKK